MARLGRFGMHAFQTLPFWLVVAGAVIAWYCYLINPKVPAAIKSSLSGVNRILENKYFVDWINEQIIARRALPAVACGRPVTAA